MGGNRHETEGNPSVTCNALNKTATSFNCRLRPNEAIQLARNILQKAQLILEEDITDGTVHPCGVLVRALRSYIAA